VSKTKSEITQLLLQVKKGSDEAELKTVMGQVYFELG